MKKQKVFEYLDSISGCDLVGVVSKVELKFGITHLEANKIVLEYTMPELLCGYLTKNDTFI